MRVSTYLMSLIFACCGCGLVVFYSLNYLHRKESQAAAEVANGDLALRDLSSLELSFQQLMVLSDLVLGSDETYLSAGAIELSDKLSQMVKTLANEMQSYPDSNSELQTVASFVINQSGRLKTASKLQSANRDDALYSLLNEMDSEANGTIDALDALRKLLENKHEVARSTLATVQKDRLGKKMALLILFLTTVLVLWYWIGQMLSRPISLLTNDSKLAMFDDREIETNTSGPVEVAELRKSFSDLVGSLREKIDQVQKQAEREGMHQELVEMSRKAGMAEVASEVLHNVGNVLNSMNVSASVTRKQLEKSVIGKLALARDMILKNKDDLGNFVAIDNRGKHFPGAFDHLTNALIDENLKIATETDQLIDNIQYVREVINTQQSFARGGGMIDTVCLSKVIENSIKINSDSLIKNDIQLIRGFSESTNLKTDKHKLQQILVNLISNARDAIIENNRERQIRITVSQEHEREELVIEVSDSGIGIPKENMSSIFSHGFTTKEHGHGFGLHSCALAAQVLGGALNVESDGVGKGATFILRLPQEQSELCKV